MFEPMLLRFCLLLLLVSACTSGTDGNDPHAADGPLLPIDLQEGREVLEVENDSRILLARGRELAEFLAPRLVSLMAQAELAEGRFIRPTQQEWLQSVRVDYRQIFNDLYQLGGKYDFSISAQLPANMQAQVDALDKLSDVDFRTAYLSLLRDQLRQLNNHLQQYTVGSLNRDYQRIHNDLEAKLDQHLTQISRIFR